MLLIAKPKRSTLPAFKKTLEEGADGAKMDVRTGDEKILQRVIKWLPDNFTLNVEIKDSTFTTQLIDILKECDKQVFVTSVWHPAVYKLSKACDVDCGIIMPIRPIYIKPFLQLLPIRMKYIVWDYQVYDSVFKEELNKYTHLVYDAGKKYIYEVDGIITDHVSYHRKRHTEALEDRRRKVRTKKVYG